MKEKIKHMRGRMPFVSCRNIIRAIVVSGVQKIPTCWFCPLESNRGYGILGNKACNKLQNGIKKEQKLTITSKAACQTPTLYFTYMWCLY